MKEKYINLKIFYLCNVIDGYIYFIMCIFTLMFMHVNFMNFYYVKIRKNGVLWWYCEVLVVNKFCVGLGTLGVYFIFTVA